MKYYTIWVSSNRHRSNTPLTYSSELSLKTGSIVVVPFGSSQILGLVSEEVNKPNFKTKSVIKLVVGQSLPSNSIQLFSWLSNYYPGAAASHLQLFLSSSILKLDESKYKKTTLTPLRKLNLPPLTVEQNNGIKQIEATNSRTILLHGETGSGKTRVYVELIHKTLSDKKSAIVLTPEIGLTPQIISVLEESFPGRVITIHSGLTDKVRRENWLRILTETEPLIVVGPRSALFVPLHNLGLIIIDEAHEASYKQEQAPYYQATRVAAKLSEITKARFVLGTATPLVSDYYVLKTKGLLTVRMTEQATAGQKSYQKPTIETVELTNRDEFTKSRWLSDKLVHSITSSLAQKEQSLVYLNRRGTALVILCQNCGWQALCPNCDTSLTYHADTHSMECHSCSFHKDIPTACPVCNSPNIIFKGAGTKAITEEIIKLFPAAKVSRFDGDNKKSDSLQENYQDLLSGRIDIAVGTQIITKGLDLPKLSTVGIVMADSSLSFPDYTAEEKTYQTIAQVIGRVARGHREGRVIIQTYHSDTVALQSAIKKDYKSFYEHQLAERKQFSFPPFVFLLKLSTKRSSPAKAREACEALAKQIRQLSLPLVINGPTPAFHEKVSGKYIWQIIVKSKNRSHLLKVVEALPANWSYDIDPASLL